MDLPLSNLREEIMGYKPNEFVDHVWMPYIPLMNVPLLGEEIFTFYKKNFDNRCYLYFKLNKYKL